MCDYSGSPSDPQRFSSDNISYDVLVKETKKFFSDSKERCSTSGLNPFYVLNPPPEVLTFPYLYTLCFSAKLIFDSPFNHTSLFYRMVVVFGMLHLKPMFLL